MWKIPPESGRHRRTWMAWPWDKTIWDKIPDTDLLTAQKTFDQIVRKIAKYEDVSLLVPNTRKDEIEERVKQGSDQGFAVETIAAEYDDIWVRDTLPTFAVSDRGSLIAINWNFNGWGRRISNYGRYGKDAQLAKKIASRAEATVVNAEVIAEGGAFAFDGSGLNGCNKECHV
jgi:agmatine deiminase